MDDEKEDAIVQVEKEQGTPSQLLAMAVEKGASIETLEKLMALQERFEANEARKAYHKAMAAFKADPPTIVKSKAVNFATKAGGRTSYRHADLAEAVNAIGEALSKHGLSAAWKTEQKAETNNVTVTCEITHVLGHSESTPLTAPPDTSGTKNSIQAIASTVTYLERYTLLAITGLAAGETDDDGLATGKATEAPSKTSTVKKAEGKKEEKAEPEIPVQQTLIDELTAYCNGDKDRMKVVLKEISYFKGNDGKEKFLTSLDKVSERWAKTSLDKLRALVKKEKEESEKEALAENTDLDGVC